MREIFRGCISAVDLRDLPALHSHAAALRRMVWRHFEAIFFTFCAFAARGPHDTWRMDKLRFREVCTNLGTLTPTLTLALALALALPLALALALTLAITPTRFVSLAYEAGWRNHAMGNPNP